MNKNCSICNNPYHSQTFCSQKPRKPIKTARRPIAQESIKSKNKRLETARKWLKQNPPDENGYWTCYLQISDMCPKQLTKELLVREHVIPKVKAPHLKYDIDNIRPACTWCNRLKDSRTLEDLAKIWPHLLQYL